MGCGSSQLVAAEQNAVRNGDVKRESPPPQQPQQQPEQIRQKSPPLKRSDSAKSKSSSSSSSSRSSSAKSKKSRPETAPGGNTPAQVELNPVKNNDDTPQTENTQNTEAPESNNNKDSENSAAVEEPEKVEETPDETTTQGAEVSTEEGNQGESQEHEKPNFSEDVLKEFVEVENQVNSLEQKGAENAHQVKHARLVELHKKIGENHGKVEQLKAQTAKEYQDVLDLSSALNVRSLFVSQDQLNAEFEKEKKEYVDALNKQEIAEQELESMKQQYKKLYDEVIAAKKDQDELNSLRKKEEELLGRIFNDSYGSDKEWKLEMELDMLGERKERIKGAHVRWKAAHVYLDYAAKQLSWSTRRWAQIASHRVTVLVVKYQMVAETRNHLIAAIQNIKSAHDHLRPINIPYCTKEDVEALQAVTNTIFNDVNIPQNYQKSYNLFASLFSKSSTLLQWVGRVVDEKISTDLAEVKKEFHEKYYELKEERMNLIKTKVKEKLGVELELEVKKDDLSDEDSSADEADIAKPGEVAKEEGDDQAPEPEDKEGVPTEAPPTAEGEAPAEEGQPPGEAEAGADSSADAASKPVALSELAPPPTQEDLFGNIDQIKKQHEEELAEFEKAQELNKARVEQGLQEKLRARRSRRRKIQAQEEETNALSGEGSSNEPPPPSEMGL